MKIRLLWPGKTKNNEIRNLQDRYVRKINRMAKCEVVETKEAKGLDESERKKILEIEAKNLENQLKDDYIICLSERGQEMSSRELARHLTRTSLQSSRAVAFVVGGFLGLGKQLMGRAHLRLSLSKMTFSHEMARIILLEQVYRALCIIKGREYTK